MDNTNTLLLAELPGLEAAKAAIDRRINEIRGALTGNSSGSDPISPPSGSFLNPFDNTMLGRDSIGRIIRRRNISPEVRAQKIELIKKARQVKLDKLKAERETPPAAGTSNAGGARPAVMGKRKSV